MAANNASSLVGADSSYWVFVIKFFYGPELDDSWECVFSVPQVAWASVVRTAGFLLVIGLSGYLSLRMYRWWTNRQLNSRLDILQCHSPIHSIGSPLESLEYYHLDKCDALDVDHLFLSSGRGPTGSSKILDKEGQMYVTPSLGSARSSLHGSPQKINRRRERARLLAASSGPSPKRTSPKHQHKYWCSAASPGGVQSSGYGTATSFSSSGARPKSIYRRSSSRESDSYSADASDNNFSRMSRSSSCSEHAGPYRRHGQKRYRQVRSSSRELLGFEEFDSCWSDVSSVDDNGRSSVERRDSTGSQGMFMGSLNPEFEVRARHAMRPAMKFEEKHRLLCKWHQLPSCMACGLDAATSVSSGIGTESLRRSLGRGSSRPRSSPDGATDNDELPELEMDDMFGTADPSLIQVADLSERQLHYIEKLRKLCGASPISSFGIGNSPPSHGVTAEVFFQQQQPQKLGAVGGPKGLGVDVRKAAECIENKAHRLRHSLSCDSEKSPQDWQGLAVSGMETPPLGMSKVNSCESFQSYASTDLSSLGCDLDFELGGETESYLDTLESELHNLKQSCFDMDSNIVNLQVARKAAAKKKAAPLLTAEEYQALAVELGLESDEDEQIAPYVSTPAEDNPAFKGLRKSSAPGTTSTLKNSSATSSEAEDVLMPLGGLGSPATTRPQTPAPSIASSTTGADPIGSRPHSHMSLEWDHTGLDEDAIGESNIRCLESPFSLPFSDAGSDDLQSASRLLQMQQHPLTWTVGIDSLTSSSAHSSLDPVEVLGASGDFSSAKMSDPGSAGGSHDDVAVQGRKKQNVLSPKLQRNARVLGRRDMHMQPPQYPQPHPPPETHKKLP